MVKKPDNRGFTVEELLTRSTSNDTSLVEILDDLEEWRYKKMTGGLGRD